MDRLAKIMFPNNPRMVRYRKMRLLLFAVFMSLFAALLVGVLFYFANRIGP